MGYIALIEHGGRTISIGESGSQYRLQPGFRPPRIELVNVYANGTAATQGGEYDTIRSTTSPVRVEIPFNVTGSSDVHVNMAVDGLNAFLQEISASRGYEPAYFSWRSNNDISHKIIWGQQNRRARIRSGYATVETSGTYGVANLREHAIIGCTLVLELDSIEGYRQAVAIASGGVFQDTLSNGNLGGVARGVTVAPAQTNIWDRVGGDGFTVDCPYALDGVALLDKRDSMAAWGLRGLHYSYKYQCSGYAGGLSSYYRTIAKDADYTYHCFSFLARREDGGAVTSTYVRIYLDGTYDLIPTAIVSIGNGWYYVYYLFQTSGDGTIDLGITAYTRRNVIATMFGLTESDTDVGVAGVGGLKPILPLHGDFPGYDWTSTVWESGWSNDAGVLKIPCTDWFTQGSGTIRFAYTRYVNSDNMNHQYTIIDVDDQIRLTHDYDGVMRLYDSAGSATVTHSHPASTAIQQSIIHITWNNALGTCLVYIDGTLVATKNTFLFDAQPNYIYLGSKADGTEQDWQTFADFQFFSNAFTQADVTADYNNLSPVMAAGRAESYIPYLWTIGGDGVFDDVVGAGTSDCGFIAGVGGDLPARTVWNINKYNAGEGTMIGMWDTYQYVDPSVYGDWSASTQSIGYPSYTVMATITQAETYTDHLIGKLAYLWVDCEDSGSAYTEKLRLRYTSGGATTADYPADPGTTGGIYVLGPLSMPRSFKLENRLNGDYTVDVDLEMTRSTGSAHNATCNVARLVFDRFWRTEDTTDNVVDGQRGYSLYQVPSEGAPPDAVPHRYNQVVIWIASMGNSGVHTDTCTVDVIIVPRYVSM